MVGRHLGGVLGHLLGVWMPLESVLDGLGGVWRRLGGVLDRLGGVLKGKMSQDGAKIGSRTAQERNSSRITERIKAPRPMVVRAHPRGRRSGRAWS